MNTQDIEVVILLLVDIKMVPHANHGVKMVLLINQRIKRALHVNHGVAKVQEIVRAQNK